MTIKLSEHLAQWRAERPDEWKMDEFIREAKRLEQMGIYDIVKKLIGPIDPAGDASIDDRRFSNLEAAIDLVEKFITDIAYVARGADAYQYSISKAGKRAKAFIDGIKEEY